MADIKITRSELADPAIDEVINLEKSLARSGGAFVEDIPTPFYLNPIFYYSLAALAAGLIAWACQEPLMNEADRREENEIAFISNYMYFGIVAGLLGLAVGLAHGIANRNLKKALYCAAVGLGVGLGASVISMEALKT